MESSGPEGGKVRGPAAMIHERYLQLARDASASGDRVLGENYLQHADHYFRLWRSTQPVNQPQQQTNDRFNDDGQEGDEESGGDMEGGDEGGGHAEGGDQPDVEFPQGQQQQQQQFDRDGRNRNRGRRSRYRPNEGEGGGEGREPREGGAREGGEREGGEVRENRGEQREGGGGQQRDERPARRERPREENAGPEGFSSGPKPAFLRGGD